MPENARRAHLIGFPKRGAPDHSDYAQGFLYACEAEGKAPATLACYREAIQRFTRAATALDLPSQPDLITRDHVRRYLVLLRDEGSSPRTVNDRLNILRVWFRWLRSEGIVETDPTDGIARAREERKPLATITPQQVSDLLAVCAQEGRSGKKAKRKAARDRALVLLLYNTGIRASELVSLDLVDIDFERILVHIRHGKGRKQRVVWLGTVPRQALWRYVTHVRGDAPGPSIRLGEGRQAAPHIAYPTLDETRPKDRLARQEMLATHVPESICRRVPAQRRRPFPAADAVGP